MEHAMSLFEGPYNLIRDNHKIIEVRLNDEKRQNINVGDIINFYKLPEKQESIEVNVIDKYHYKNFEELYSSFELSLFGCDGYTMERMINETYEIYTKEQEAKYGALGIKISLILK